MPQFPDQSTDVGRPLDAEGGGRARRRELHGIRDDPRFLDAQPLVAAGSAAGLEPGGKRLRPGELPRVGRSRLIGGRGVIAWRLSLLHGSEIAGRGPHLEHAVAAIRPCRRGESQAPAGHVHVGPDRDPAGQGFRCRRQVDVERHGEVIADDLLGPATHVVLRQPQASRRLRLKHRRREAEAPHDEPVRFKRDVEGNAAAVDREPLLEPAGIADGELLERGIPLHPAPGRIRRDIHPQVRDAVNEMGQAKPRGQHARRAQRESVSGGGDRPRTVGGGLGRRDRPTAIADEHGRRRCGDCRAVEPHRRRRQRHWQRGRPRSAGSIGVPQSASGGPAGDRAVAEERARGDHVGEPPGILPDGVDEFDRAVDDLQFQRRRPARRRQPGGENVFEGAAVTPHLHQGLGTGEPHGAEATRSHGQVQQAAIEREVRQDHRRATGAIPEDDVAILDAP